MPDAPAPVTPAWQAGESVRHPVIAPWLADRGQRGQAARWALGFVRHWALFYLARLLIYVCIRTGHRIFEGCGAGGDRRRTARPARGSGTVTIATGSRVGVTR